VWIIPLLAALVGLSLVVRAVMEQGPTIHVTFATAEGIEPGKTKVKFKDVDIGEVRSVRLVDHHTRVLVTINLPKQASEFASADSRFWVVRPRLAGASVSGLGTLLSGSYIGADGGRSSQRQTEFTGLEQPPAVEAGVPGRRFRLTATDLGSLDIGSPVYFRHIQVGHVENFMLQPDGQHIALGIFVQSPYDQFVTTDTRFWHASGVDLSLTSSGIKLETQSLVTVLLGGIAFESPGDFAAAEPAQEGAQFALVADKGDALRAPDGIPQPVVLNFAQSVRGLSVGAPVDLRGLPVGYVRSVGVTYDRKSGDFVAPVVVDIYPARLGPALPQAETQPLRMARLANLVARGLRAQLRSGNLLTGQVYVALDFFPEAKPVAFDPTVQPPELPTVPGDLEELQRQLQSIAAKLDKVPFATLGQDAHQTMTGLEASLKRLNDTLQQADHEVLPEIRDSLRQLQRTLQSTGTPRLCYGEGESSAWPVGIPSRYWPSRPSAAAPAPRRAITTACPALPRPRRPVPPACCWSSPRWLFPNGSIAKRWSSAAARASCRCGTTIPGRHRWRTISITW
jgi:paraquat-inducible protein B